MLSAVRCSIWNDISSAISSWTCSEWRSAQKRRHRSRTVAMNCLLGSLHDALDGERKVLPIRLFHRQLPAARPGQAVEARTPVVIGYAPFTLDPTAAFDPVKRRIKRSFFDLKHVMGELLDALADAVTMHPAQR